MNKNSYQIHDTTIYYRNNTVKAPKGADSWRFKYPHFGTLHRLFNMLRAEGFTIENDAEVAKCIRDDYFIGRRGDLELYAHRYPAGFEIMFFQNIVIENQNGGRYDFDKLRTRSGRSDASQRRYKVFQGLERSSLPRPRLSQYQ